MREKRSQRLSKYLKGPILLIKKLRNKVGPGLIMKVSGLLHKHYKFVHLVTTSSFSRSAKEERDELEGFGLEGLKLVDGEELIRRLNEHLVSSIGSSEV